MHGNDLEHNAYDLRARRAQVHLVAAPSGAGKTVLVANLLRVKDEYIIQGNEIKNVVFCYSAWQPLYEELKEEGIVTQWVNKLPTNEEFKELVVNYMDDGGSIVVLDDFLTELNKDIAEIVCVTSRHYNTTTFLLLQNLFPSNPWARQISLNAKYIYVLKNPRENAQISYLARQINPRNYKWIVDAYYEATKMPYGCFLIDMTQETPEILRFRSNVLQQNFPMIVYVQK